MRLGILILAFVSCSVITNAATIEVPKDQGSIQAAIDLAMNGDTVLVAPGIYVENIDFKGKAILVKSSNGPKVTKIDGWNPVNPNFGSVVLFVNNEGQDSILEGFTLSNGAGTWFEYYPSIWAFCGGGIICCSTASPKIINNIISTNSADSGGGIYCQDAWPVIMNNKIFNNSALANGGGIRCWNSSPVISNNTFTGNFAPDGGGISCLYSSPNITNNIVSNNSAPGSAYPGCGGGILCQSYSSPNVENNIISGNSASRGGGICCFEHCSPIISNNTITGNLALAHSGGILCEYYCSVTVTDSIIWSNSSPSVYEIWIGEEWSPSAITISYSDVDGGQASVYSDLNCSINWGPGMIDMDPMFFDPINHDFHLKQHPCQPSIINPCVDAGSDNVNNLNYSNFWTRTDQVYDTGIIDIGYHYGGNATLLLNVNSISQSLGGQVLLNLDAGHNNANRYYFIFSGVTGTFPGFSPPPGKITIPINWDVFTNLAMNLMNTTIFNNFYGLLNTKGQSTATFDTLGPFIGGAGLVISFAFALDLYYWDFASNSVSIEIVP